MDPKADVAKGQSPGAGNLNQSSFPQDFNKKPAEIAAKLLNFAWDAFSPQIQWIHNELTKSPTDPRFYQAMKALFNEDAGQANTFLEGVLVGDLLEQFDPSNETTCRIFLGVVETLRSLAEAFPNSRKQVERMENFYDLQIRKAVKKINTFGIVDGKSIGDLPGDKIGLPEGQLMQAKVWAWRRSANAVGDLVFYCKSCVDKGLCEAAFNEQRIRAENTLDGIKLENYDEWLSSLNALDSLLTGLDQASLRVVRDLGKQCLVRSAGDHKVLRAYVSCFRTENPNILATEVNFFERVAHCEWRVVSNCDRRTLTLFLSGLREKLGRSGN
jgi:hypothetical protein